MSTRIVVFDDEDSEFGEQLVSTEPVVPEVKRRRGRPKGSLGRVNQDHDVTLSDFSYLRAIVQGIDAKKAAHRYLQGKIYLSPASCAEYETKLRGILQRTIKVLMDEQDKIVAGKNLGILNSPTLEMVALGPSLDDFAARFDSDMYSEAELQELYVEEFGAGLDQSNQQEGHLTGYGIKSKLAALTWLSNKVAKKPSPSDPIELWIDPGLGPKLRQHGVVTIGNLMDWVNIQGRSFYLRLRGFGVTRARRLVLWLMDNEESIGRRLDRRIRFQQFEVTGISDVVPSTAVAGTVQIFGIVPMELFAWPVQLFGQNGVFRANGPNTFGANNDKEAILAWFATLDATAKHATQLSYKRAIERLVLWSIVERKTPLSSLVTEHFVAFREFLRDPPVHWCTKFPTVRYSPDWRPLRGPMNEASIQQTFSAISALFSALNSCGYLMANAVSSVRTSVKRDLRMDVMRSFSEEDLVSIANTMNELEDGPAKRRLRAIILLLQTGGFRRGEAISLRYKNLSPLRHENRLTNTWVARFVGKGGKERQVPIKAETYEALQAHYADRRALSLQTHMNADDVPMGRPTLTAYRDLPYEETPLLGVLDDRFSDGRGSTLGETPGHASVKPNVDGALSYGRIHSILKEFFGKVAERNDLPSGHANFLKSSAHWLRHTFGLQAMIASKGDLSAIQQILGHSDIATTGIYMKADLGSRASVIEGIRPAV